jgi:L-alanine-DL-glutamate epimerase-like enolase superfamily enzyme
VAYGSAESKKNYFVSIDGKYFGEASGSVYYGPKEDNIVKDLETARDFLQDNVGMTEDDIDRTDLNPVSKSAIIPALIHKASGERNIYPWEVMGLEAPGKVRTSFTVSIDEPEAMLHEIGQCPYPIVKIKMGFDEDEALIPPLEKVSGKIFRIDANGGWTPEKAERMLFRLSRLNVDMIEQPTKPDHIRDWKYLKGSSKACLIVDESMNTIDDYFRYCDYVNGVNIKMAKCGGIVEAARIARQARKDRLKVMLGCMVESSVAISQAVYLASLADYFDLDGPLLLKNDIATGIKFNLELITVDEGIIGGPKILKEYLDETTPA